MMQEIGVFNEKGNTTMKNNSNMHCQAVKFGPDHDQATMGNGGTLWHYEGARVCDRMEKFIIQESLPFDHFDNLRSSKLIQQLSKLDISM